MNLKMKSKDPFEINQKSHKPNKRSLKGIPSIQNPQLDLYSYFNLIY
jgi:hypothetical protein